jgi:hypothetical protein
VAATSAVTWKRGSEVVGVVEVVRSSCGKREEVVERELLCCFAARVTTDPFR